ncbi:MAG: hypothetical protein M3065_15155 [Actinomycetota bacterium]|nr:hypothetical protein [Actinomycetota bacterium]
MADPITLTAVFTPDERKPLRVAPTYTRAERLGLDLTGSTKPPGVEACAFNAERRL